MSRILAMMLLVACTKPSSDDPASTPDASTTMPPVTCGNGHLDAGEMCDGNALDGYSCSALGLGTGTLACRADCLGFDAAGCADPIDPPMCVP